MTYGDIFEDWDRRWMFLALCRRHGSELRPRIEMLRLDRNRVPPTFTVQAIACFDADSVATFMQVIEASAVIA